MMDWATMRAQDDELFRKLGLWTTSEGDQIHVNNMSTKHIENSIRMVYRNSISTDWIRVLVAELDKKNHQHNFDKYL